MEPQVAAASPPPPLSTSSPSGATATTDAVGSPTSPILIHGKYVLGRLLGRGNFAKVYHARSVSDNTSVAIKIIDKVKTDPAMAPLILREVDAMRRLKHPNILRIYEVLATKSKIYLVMELAKGGDLFAKLSRRPGRRFPEPVARKYFNQLVSALHYCHLNGVAHRDMKPQNILLDEHGNLKIADFGLSAVAAAGGGGLGILQTACGTPAFAAPEVVGRRGGYDGAKSDAWSCGVILYAMLSGSLPFDDRNLVSMFRKMQRRDIHFPIHVTRPARSLIVKLLDPNPQTRLSIDSITKDPWYKSSQFGQRSVSLGDLVSMNEEKFERKASSMNAFDIISMSSGLNLSGLFDEEGSRKKKERRFTTKESVGDVVEKVVEVGRGLGYEVERGRGGKIWLGKERLVLIVEALEVGQDVLVVELRVVEGGCGGGGMDEGQWRDLKSGLGEIVTSWHSEATETS